MVDYERRIAAISSYVEMTDRQQQPPIIYYIKRQQQPPIIYTQNALGMPSRHPRTDRYTSKLMGKSTTPANTNMAAARLGRDVSRLSIGSLG